MRCRHRQPTLPLKPSADKTGAPKPSAPKRCTGAYAAGVGPELLRRQVGGTVRRLVAGSDAQASMPIPDPGDPGLIPLDSPVRIVHADSAMFVGGVRALLFQTLHPVAMYAVANHSDFEHDPLGRLQRTAGFLGATTFGGGTAGTQVINIVRAIHERVAGTMADGTPYAADDPHLLNWVHATEIDSFLTGNQRYGRQRLTDPEADRYIADMAVIAEALGARNVPTSQAELAETIEAFRPELAPSTECRDATRFLFAPPLPRTVLPFYGLIFTSAVASLPQWARSMLLLPVAPGVDSLLLRPATKVLTSTLRWAMTPTE